MTSQVLKSVRQVNRKDSSSLWFACWQLPTKYYSYNQLGLLCYNCVMNHNKSSVYEHWVVYLPFQRLPDLQTVSHRFLIPRKYPFKFKGKKGIKYSNLLQLSVDISKTSSAPGVAMALVLFLMIAITSANWKRKLCMDKKIQSDPSPINETPPFWKKKPCRRLIIVTPQAVSRIHDFSSQ